MCSLMAVWLQDLLQLLGKADLGLACRDYRHRDTITIGRVIRLFGERRWLARSRSTAAFAQPSQKLPDRSPPHPGHSRPDLRKPKAAWPQSPILGHATIEAFDEPIGRRLERDSELSRFSALSKCRISLHFDLMVTVV